MTAESERATLTIHATAEVPIPHETEEDEHIVRDDTQAARRFIVDHATITYTQERTNPATHDEQIGPWSITAVVSGARITAGATGHRRTSRAYISDADGLGIPSWLTEHVERYHPDKRS